MKEAKIKRVENNKSKGKTYAAIMSNYNLAIESGFYGEAELIVYAYLEDRLRSFLYYSGFIDTYNSRHINENGMLVYGGEACINDISTKISIIKSSFKAINNHELKDNMFIKELKRNYNITLNIPEIKKMLNKVEDWCKYRNEIIHGMFNKDLEALRSGYLKHVKEGFEFGRYIDQQVKNLKEA